MPRSSRPSLVHFAALLAVCAALLGVAADSRAADDKQKFRLAWTIYVGWMPWDYAEESGILKKWADKYGIEIDAVQLNDYVESINQFTAGAFDACVMTNMDALTIPAAGGVDSTALIVGDFSNGNDGIILKGKSNLVDIKGQNVNLVELSVSHYLLARALDSIGASERDLKVINTSDADIVAASAAEDTTAIVTWNPQLSEILKSPGMHRVFDSSQIPGEIIDLTVVNSKTLAANPAFGKALAGAWYEVMALMARDDDAGRAVRSALGKASGTDLTGYDAQLATTRMFYNAAEAVTFTRSAELAATMRKVAEFSFAHGLLGEGAPGAEYIGIETAAGTVGDPGNVKLRFEPAYMQMAADGKL
ncbi:MAG: putative urea ABC transporter substrate-binding protein [Gammaproteobacteria bacterium]